jgi:hypothetical protein
MTLQEITDLIVAVEMKKCDRDPARLADAFDGRGGYVCAQRDFLKAISTAWGENNGG